MSKDIELEDVLSQLQIGTLYADNTEPAMTNNRNIAKREVLGLIDRELLLAKITDKERLTFVAQLANKDQEITHLKAQLEELKNE